VPYKTDADLPESVRDALPEHAQDIYRAAYNSAWDEYDDASKRRGSKSDSAIAELEWKMHSAMISSGLVIGPIVAIVVIALIVWLVFF